MARGWVKGFDRPPLWATIVMLVGLVVLAFIGMALRSGDRVPQPEIDRAAAAASASESARNTPIVAAFLGDSYTYGHGTPTGGYVSTTATGLGWSPVRLGQTGTGYVNPGNGADGTPSAPYINRVPQVVAAHPAVVIVQGGLNDVGTSGGGNGREQAAAAAVFAALKTQLPNTPVVVVGPTQVPSKDPQQTSLISGEIAAAAKAAGLPFIDPLAEKWLATSDSYQVDGLHPTDAGYRQYGGLLAKDLRGLVGPALLRRG